jgi:hypothetical protein
MTRAALLLAFAPLAFGLAACGGGARHLSSSASRASHERAEPDERAEMAARLAGATFGRTPGQPTSCVDVADLRSNRALGAELILFDGADGRQWVNRVQNCPALRYNRTVRLTAPVARLCRGGQVEVMDAGGATALGRCAVGDFLSYVPRQ